MRESFRRTTCCRGRNAQRVVPSPRSADSLRLVRRARPQWAPAALMLEERSGLAEERTAHEYGSHSCGCTPIRSCRRDECIARLANDSPGALTRRRRRSQVRAENPRRASPSTRSLVFPEPIASPAPVSEQDGLPTSDALG